MISFKQKTLCRQWYLNYKNVMIIVQEENEQWWWWIMNKRESIKTLASAPQNQWGTKQWGSFNEYGLQAGRQPKAVRNISYKTRCLLLFPISWCVFIHSTLADVCSVLLFYYYLNYAPSAHCPSGQSVLKNNVLQTATWNNSNNKC